MKSAHVDMQADPTFPDATDACGECHAEETELAKTSLHYTLATYKPMIHERGTLNAARWAELDRGMDNHCFSCHASCGECHISRPNSAKGGFISGHNFNKTPDWINQCTACHGSRVGNEYTGATGSGDIHYTKHDMTCVDCHGTQDLHGDGKSDHHDRYDVEGLASCQDCHELDDEIEQHAIHGDKVSCYVCHSQAYVNCYSCHVGLDDKDLAYFKNEEEEELFRIGRNPDPTEERPEKWIVVRRVPVAKETFEFYGKELLPRFDRVNNWKYTSPHNIQRITTQNRECDNCHGNEELFLTADKVQPEVRRANQSIVVPREMIPEKQGRDKPDSKKEKLSYFSAAGAGTEQVFVKGVQVAEWIDSKDQKLRVIDCRYEEESYLNGHVPGAIYFDVSTKLLVKGPWDTVGVRQRLEAQEELFGRQLGISKDTMVILYDDSGESATRLFWELKYAGHDKVALLFGSWPEWQAEKLPVEKKANKVVPALFVAEIQQQLLATSSSILASMENPDVVLLDARPPKEFKGDAKHPAAKIGGHIPNAVNAFAMVNWKHNIYPKDPDLLLQMYADLGVTPDKEIVVYCNTGIYAANTYFILKALGFPNVRVYDYSWVEWCQKDFLPKTVRDAE